MRLAYVSLLINYRLCLHSSYPLEPKVFSLIPLSPPIHLLLCCHVSCCYKSSATLTSKKFQQPVVLVFLLFVAFISLFFLIFGACPIDCLNVALVFTQYTDAISVFCSPKKLHYSLLKFRYLRHARYKSCVFLDISCA
jgi:hypothetical protein